MYLTVGLLLLTTLSGTVADQGMDMHFVGGSMSFKFINTTGSTYQVKITSLTGWVLGKGPCGPSCSSSDIGKSTFVSRQARLNVLGEIYFGNWSEESGSSSDERKTYHIITTEVNNKLQGQVAAVNVPMKWEQEVATVVIPIDPIYEYTDVSMYGFYWREFNYLDGVLNYPVEYRLQIKVKPEPRKDTGKPNNSPVALFKPVYKILLNKATTIKVATMDEDGDFVRCVYAEFVEAGGLGVLNNTVVNSDCSVVIDAQESAGFFDGGWGAIAVKVYDVPAKPDITDPLSDASRFLSSVNVQFMIQTLRAIDAPLFVDPTPPSHHKFTVFVGSTFVIPLYAKPVEFSLRREY